MITIKNIRQRLAYIENIMHMYEGEHQALTQLAKIYDDPKYHDVRELVECVDQSTWAPAPAPAVTPVSHIKATQTLGRVELDNRRKLLEYIQINSPVSKTQRELTHLLDLSSEGRTCEALNFLARQGKITKSKSRPTTYTYIKGGTE